MSYVSAPAPAPVYYPSGPTPYEYGPKEPYPYGGVSSGGGGGDYSGHASDVAPVMSGDQHPSASTTNLRYGDRINPNRPANGEQSDRSNRPIRIVQRVRIRTRPPTSSPETEPNNHYEPSEEIDSQNPPDNTVKIAFVPIKQSDLEELSYHAQSGDSDAPQTDYALPESLVNYIKLVQKTKLDDQPTSDGQSSSDQSKPDSEQPPTDEPIRELPSPPPTPIQIDEPISSPLRPIPSFTYETKPSPVDFGTSTPPSISALWETQFQQLRPYQQQQPAQQHQGPIQFNPTEYKYGRTPELKVMRNLPRYHEPELPKNGFQGGALGGVQTGVSPSGRPQHTQFLYQVSHQNPPLPPMQPPPTQFITLPVFENFGLESYQEMEKQKPAASNTYFTWLKPNGRKFRFWDGFAKRLSKLI